MRIIAFKVSMAYEPIGSLKANNGMMRVPVESIFPASRLPVDTCPKVCARKCRIATSSLSFSVMSIPFDEPIGASADKILVDTLIDCRKNMLMSLGIVGQTSSNSRPTMKSPEASHMLVINLNIRATKKYCDDRARSSHVFSVKTLADNALDGEALNTLCVPSPAMTDGQDS